MDPLPKPSVDTGMGLERITAVLQHVNSNYDVLMYEQIALLPFLILFQRQLVDVLILHHPSNEGRGYVLRRIIRRAVRHGYMLGAKDTFFYKLVAPLIEVMAEAGEELKRQQAIVEKVLKTEEEQFARTFWQRIHCTV